MTALEEARSAVAVASHRLAAAGLLIGTAGNVNMLVDGHVVVTVTGADLSRITPDEVTVIGAARRVVAGHLGRPRSSTCISGCTPSTMPRP